MIRIASHPALELKAFTASLPTPLGEVESPAEVLRLFDVEAEAPLATDDQVRRVVRDLLRHGGFKPTGRSKPASEYLIKAAKGGFLSSINVLVDACNAVSLHSGLPISVVDVDRAEGSFRVDIAPKGTRYVFNASGQEIDLSGLLCLFDAQGAIANAVKDSQRTKTHEGTRSALVVVWGTKELPGRAQAVSKWYQALLHGAGVGTEEPVLRVG